MSTSRLANDNVDAAGRKKKNKEGSGNKNDIDLYGC
jgi:hypothetical protein